MIIYDGYANDCVDTDQGDTIRQVKKIHDVLKKQENDTWCHDVYSLNRLEDVIETGKYDIVFNLVESLHNSGRLIHVIPSLLDYMQVPYTGSSADAIYTTSNKLLAKKIMRGYGIPTPEEGEMEYPYIIKSIWEHASIGINDQSVIYSFPETPIPHNCFAERYIEGREFNVSMIEVGDELRILPIAEIVFDDYPDNLPKIVGFNAKWIEDSFEYRHTRRDYNFVPESFLIDRLRVISLKCWELFGLNGYARIDFRVDKDNNPFVIDINANPCLSPEAGFAAACNQQGISYNEMIKCIIDHPVKL